MSILKDLVNLKPAIAEVTAVNKGGVEMALAQKHMNEMLNKGYQKVAAINYVAKIIKSQGFTESYAKDVATQAYKDVGEIAVNESFNDPAAVADELMDAYEQLVEIMDNVKGLIHACPSDIRRHAESYWLAHIITALGDDHEYMGGTSKYDTMKATIEKLREEESQED